jgi:4-alpha-glucanotransferase
MTALHSLAAAAGLQRDWIDAAGRCRRVTDDALIAILGALGFPADNADAIDSSRHQLSVDNESCSFLSATVGEAVVLPSSLAGRMAELRLEDGRIRTFALSPSNMLTLDCIGYHDLLVGDVIIRLAIAPPRCFRLADATAARIWAPAVQIPALRSDRPTSFGDFGALATTAKAFAARGANALAMSPVHALFPADASRFSPYAPSSRLFLNVFLADPSRVGASTVPATGPELIDWEGAIPERMRVLRSAFETADDQVQTAVCAFAAAGGQSLEDHVRFDALHAHFFSSGARGWQDWPPAYQDPESPAVTGFAHNHESDIAFFRFLQWLAHDSLDAAQAAATHAGMAIGLIADLAVGMDSGGSDAWSRRGDLMTGLSIGAPPDLLGPDGQGWGITGFDPRALRRSRFEPFIATLRAALDHAGGIRIDHALGLRRLWVIPHGASPSDGAYLDMPLDDMLHVLAIESHRARAIVIGEDLGTVPEGLRPAMTAHGVLGMKVLWFEHDESWSFCPVDQWPVDSAAMTGTHDLATVAGWWQGRDLDWAWRLGRTSAAASEAQDRATRVHERAQLWSALDAGGLEPSPNDTGPVVDAAISFVGSTPCPIAILPMEDLVGLIEQPNLPGTTDQHPNWRRRMPDATDALLSRPEVAARTERLNEVRSA